MTLWLRTTLTLLLVAADLFVLAGVWRMHAQVRRAVPVQAELHAIDRRSSGATSRSGGGRIEARYSYVVDGHRHGGSRIAFGSQLVGGSASSNLDLQSHADALAAQRESHRLAALRQGGTPAPVITTAWIDPEEPGESALMRRLHPVIHVIGWVGLVLLVIGGVELVRAARGLRSGARAPMKNGRTRRPS